MSLEETLFRLASSLDTLPDRVNHIKLYREETFFYGSGHFEIEDPIAAMCFCD